MPFLKRRAQSFWPVARQFLVEGLGWSCGVFFQFDYERKTTCSTFFLVNDIVEKLDLSLLKRCKKSISSCISTGQIWVRGFEDVCSTTLLCFAAWGMVLLLFFHQGRPKLTGTGEMCCARTYVRRGYGIFSRLQETLKIDIPFLMVVLLINSLIWNPLFIGFRDSYFFVPDLFSGPS